MSFLLMVGFLPPRIFLEKYFTKFVFTELSTQRDLGDACLDEELRPSLAPPP